MRDYVLTQSLFRDSAFAFPKLRRMIRGWLAKRDLRRLERFDDYMLRDIGLSRADLSALCRLPADADVEQEMERLRDARLRRGQRGA